MDCTFYFTKKRGSPRGWFPPCNLPQTLVCTFYFTKKRGSTRGVVPLPTYHKNLLAPSILQRKGFHEGVVSPFQFTTKTCLRCLLYNKRGFPEEVVPLSTLPQIGLAPLLFYKKGGSLRGWLPPPFYHKRWQNKKRVPEGRGGGLSSSI